uniref:Bloodthirsty-related gene family, member 1 n=1 Tax=Sphaeramia orbicularis TaxID=375764 RepID=A0A672Y6H6_9TELE
EVCFQKMLLYLFCWSIDMAAAGRVRSEDQFQCSICLDVFTDPVTTSCGQNFCKSCISEHWRVNVPYRCPMCKEVFNTKPGTVERAVSELENKLRKDKKKEAEADLKRVQQYEVDLTLDPDTAHPRLILSDDGKQVHTGDERRNLLDKPQRFTNSPCILQSFSSGRIYFEVQVKGKTDWALGVVRRSINRKGGIPLSPQSGYWTIGLRNGNQCIACAAPPVPLSVKSGLQKVGVFVDYEEGLVSFYDVGSSVLIYSFIGCCFSDKLLPFFGPCPNAGGSNSAPLIITPVRH